MMRHPRRIRPVVTIVALAAGAGLAVNLLLPPAARVIETEPSPDVEPGPAGSVAPDDFPPTARGAYHVHSRRSDGSGTVPEIAAAAAAADLDFVILTDHGDATRIAPPAYHGGVLMIDGVEISTNGGHYAAVGIDAAPYPLGGDARGVVEDVRRLGGFGIAAHPTSPKPGLAWLDPSLPVDAVEWLNGDTAWRDESWTSLARVIASYWIRPAESLALLLERPDPALDLWDDLASARSVVGLSAGDAHARLADLDDGEGYGRGKDFVAGPGPDDDSALHLPAYEAVFRVASLQIELDQPLTGRALADAATLLAQLRAGRVYTSVDAIAAPARFSWTGRTTAGQLVRMGQWTAGDTPVALAARIAGPPDATFTLRRNGEPVVAAEPGPVLAYDTPVAPDEWAAYRVEVYLPGAPGTPPAPWIIGNPIYVGGSPSSPAAATGESVAESAMARFLTGEWHVEQRDADVSLTADVAAARTETADSQVRLTFELGAGAETYAAAAHPLGSDGLAGAAAVRFDAEASRPMRLSFQVRRSGESGEEGGRWRRSFYADQERRTVTIPLSQLAPVTGRLPVQPDLATIDSVLIVIDTLNTLPRTSGSVTITAPRLLAP